MVAKTKPIWTAAILASMLIVAGCGTNGGRRVVSGGSFGTGSHTLVSTAPGNVDAGAMIGASTGQTTSAIVDPCTLNVYDPVWRDHGGRAAYERRCGHPPPP